jgi:hypothetical protein
LCQRINRQQQQNEKDQHRQRQVYLRSKNGNGAWHVSIQDGWRHPAALHGPDHTHRHAPARFLAKKIVPALRPVPK